VNVWSGPDAIDDAERRKMQELTRRPIGLGWSLLLLLAPAAVLGCGEKSEPAPSPGPRAGAEAGAPAADQGAENGEPAPAAPGLPPQGKPSGPAEDASGDPRPTALERSAARTVRSYVAALDRRDGERVCALLEPGALAGVELPRRRGSCAASLTASIGFRDPRGLPVWQGARISRIRSIELGGRTAKLVVTTVTRFADRAQVSIEDDVLYLTRDGGRWLIVKPSSTLYRAVGIADVPPSVLAPPG
jgi:hypothetical protein